MTKFTSSKVSAIGDSGKGYVVVEITTKSDTVGHIKVDYKFDGYFIIMAEYSKSDWTFSSSIVNGSLSEPPGYIGDGSYNDAWLINTIEKDFDLPKSDTTTSLSFSFQSNLPYNPPDYPANNYSYSGSVNVTFPKGNYYTPPSNLRNPVIENITTTSFTASASWDGGTGADGRCYISTNGQKLLQDNDPVTFTGLTPNTQYTVKFELSEKNHTSTVYETIYAYPYTALASPSGWVSVDSSSTSITVSATSPNGGNFKYQYSLNNSNWQDSGTFTGLTPNTQYTVYARCYSNSQGTTSGVISTTRWTYPLLNNPSLSLPSGSEHNSILVSVNVNGSTSYAQYAYRIDNGSWSSWTISTSYTFTGLGGHTSHTIGTKMRNTSSGLESSETTATITTWYNPLTGLTVNLVNKWFWYLLINCSYSYQGGSGNIVKYEFDIGSQGYQDKGTTNSHSRGTTSSTGSNKLNYNTDYVCKVRVTDNHARQYEANAIFKTLDARCSYINGVLKEIFIVKPDNSTVMITPNLCTIITKDGSIINMNKIINNDDRLEYQ